MADLLATLTRVGTAAFEAESGSGGKLVLDGTPAIGGKGRGMRPMELLVTALAGCAAMDVVSILAKQKEPLEDLRIDVEAARKDAIPARLESAHLRFLATGDVNPKKLERAARLSVEKYCSVKDSLDPALPITFETSLL